MREQKPRVITLAKIRRDIQGPLGIRAVSHVRVLERDVPADQAKARKAHWQAQYPAAEYVVSSTTHDPEA